MTFAPSEALKKTEPEEEWILAAERSHLFNSASFNFLFKKDILLERIISRGKHTFLVLSIRMLYVSCSLDI